jgi:hypothetical protein
MAKNTDQSDKGEVEALRAALEEQRINSNNQNARLMRLIQDLTAQRDDQPPPPGSPELEAMMTKIAKLEESVQKQEKIAATGIDMEKLVSKRKAS